MFTHVRNKIQEKNYLSYCKKLREIKEFLQEGPGGGEKEKGEISSKEFQ